MRREAVRKENIVFVVSFFFLLSARSLVADPVNEPPRSASPVKGTTDLIPLSLSTYSTEDAAGLALPIVREDPSGHDLLKYYPGSGVSASGSRTTRRISGCSSRRVTAVWQKPSNGTNAQSRG